MLTKIMRSCLVAVSVSVTLSFAGSLVAQDKPPAEPAKKPKKLKAAPIVPPQKEEIAATVRALPALPCRARG